MKRSLLCLLSSLVVWSSPSSGAPGEADWRKVDELIEKQEPKSAIAALAPLEAAALAEKAWPEAARAMAMRILIESALEQDKPEGRIVRMEAALAGAPQEMLPVLQTLSANWFYEYFQENKWAIMQRTAGGAGKDVAAWDLKRLLAETDARFQKALSAAPVLRQTPIAKWDGLLPAGKLPDLYQPTLYDFVAREALAFYTMAEQAGAAEQNAFEFDEKSAALGTLEEFLAWKPGQGNSSKLQAIRLYQELLTFHKDDADPGARALLDIERLEWAGETATGEGAAARARQQIGAIAQKVATHEVSLRAKSQVAAGLMHEHKHVEARKLLQEAVAAFDKSVFAPRARNLVKQIEGRELSAGTELMWNAAQPEISITSRNLKKAFFRLYLVSDKPDPAKVMSEWEDVDEEKVQRLIKAKPARSWEADLPGPDDFM
ncbi:MAG TPA: hypothetical protein VHM91_19020, partial [Verrucomicrobiales bacterium]|nr:hypothetical protein [Verrucomicrobiales bacterium]